MVLLCLILEKYKDKSVEEILRKEPQYYDWIMRGDFALDTKKSTHQTIPRNFI